VTVVVPRGLAIVHGRRHHPGTTVAIAGAKLKSVTFSHGRIVITLRRPAQRMTITIRGLAVTRTLARAVRRHKVKRLTIAIIPRDSAGARTLLGAVFAVRP
jgi:RNase P protein component